VLVYRAPESARKPQLKAPAAFWGRSRRSRRASRLSRTSNADRTVFSASFRIVDGGHVVRTLRGLTREYGRSILTGKANLGYCPICERRTIFVESGPWLRDQYLCVRCRSIPRWRALIHTLNLEFPNWRELKIHESSPMGPASRKLRREAPAYSASQYLLPDVPRGSVVGNVTCQDLEALSFADNSFDLFITQDVLEHVLRPELAVKEIARVTGPGGAHVFTVPIHRGRRTLVRAIPAGSGIEHLHPPRYHGNPVDPNGSLVVREWGDDFVDFVAEHIGLQTEAHQFRDRRLGLDGEYLEVFVTRGPLRRQP